MRKRGERDGEKITFDASVRREQREGRIIKCASLCGGKCAYECVYVCGGVGGGHKYTCASWQTAVD